MASEPIPTPGSDAALEVGCSCPVLDNAHGRGFPWNGEIAFWIAGDCILHGVEEVLPLEEPEDDLEVCLGDSAPPRRKSAGV